MCGATCLDSPGTLTPTLAAPETSCRRMHSACVRPLLLVPHHRPSMLARSIRLLCPRRVRAFSSAAAQVASPVDKSDGPPGPAAPLSDDQHRLLQVGIVGVPNAGKSTLTNALVGQKVRVK